jgi:steroid Delta-isomerase
MATNEQIRATIADYVAAFAANDRTAWLALYAADATLEDPVGSEVKHGAEGIGEFWDFTHTLADSISLEANGPACVAGHEAAFPIRIVSEIGGSKVVLNAIDVMTFTDDAKIASMRAFWDMADMVPYEA